jgi:hypothetical protein
MASEKSVILSFIFWVKIQCDDFYAESMSRRSTLTDLYPIHHVVVSCQTKACMVAGHNREMAWCSIGTEKNGFSLPCIANSIL